MAARHSRVLASIIAVSLFAVAGFAQERTAKIVTVSDEASSTPGRTEISDYTGFLPPDKTTGRNIPQMPGWPVPIGGVSNFNPSRGLVFEDLDGDGTLEIITSSTDYRVYAFDYTGAPMPGFPLVVIQMPQRAPSVGDLDGDGDMEIVQFTRGMTYGGRMYIIDHEGNVLPGFPKSINNNNLSGAPTLYDFDNDGYLEILVPERDWPLGFLHVVEMDGSEWGGNWPVALDHVPTGTAAVGDVDADGDVEIVYLSYDSIYVLEVDGTICPGWPKQLVDAKFSYQSPALADLDGDGDLEIAVGAHKTNSGCYIFHHDGTPVKGWPKLVWMWTYCPPTVTDLERDGKLEIIFGHQGTEPVPSEAFWAWTAKGTKKPGFPYISDHGGGCNGPLTVADIDNDGKMEIFTDHNVTIDDLGFVFGVNYRGKDLPGFPLRPQGFTYMNGPTIGDVDGDGDYELGVISYSTVFGLFVNLYDLPGTYHPSDVDWETYHKRNRRGGLRHSEDKLHIQGYFGLGSPMNLYVHDQPGYKAFLWISLDTAMIGPTKYGWFYLNMNPPMFFTLVSNSTIPVEGEIVVPLVVPNDPALKGVSFYFQGLTGADPSHGDGTVTNLLGRTVQ